MTTLQPQTPREEALYRCLIIALAAMNDSISHLQGSIAGKTSEKFYTAAAKDISSIFRKAQTEITDVLQSHESKK